MSPGAMEQDSVSLRRGSSETISAHLMMRSYHACEKTAHLPMESPPPLQSRPTLLQ